jgi:hypothetical protein
MFLSERADMDEVPNRVGRRNGLGGLQADLELFILRVLPGGIWCRSDCTWLRRKVVETQRDRLIEDSGVKSMLVPGNPHSDFGRTVEGECGRWWE